MDMDLGMDIAGYSVANASANVQQSVSDAFQNIGCTANAGRPVDKNDGDVCKPFCGRQHRYPFVILYEAKTEKEVQFTRNSNYVTSSPVIELLFYFETILLQPFLSVHIRSDSYTIL